MTSKSVNIPAIERLPFRDHEWFLAAQKDVKAAISAFFNWLNDDDATIIDVENIGDHRDGDVRHATLLLAPENVLIKTISLPATARKHIKNIVENKIRQITPFELDQVFYGFKRTESKDKSISVQVIVIPKSEYEKVLATAEENLISIDRLEVKGFEGIDLLPNDRGHSFHSNAEINRLFKINGALLILALALVFVGGGIRFAIADIKAANAATSVTEVLQARREAQKISSASKDLQQLQASAPDIVPILNVLAASIGDDAWLDKISLDRGNIELQGYAKNAADVLFAVDQVPEISNAAFKSTIRRDASTGNERFQISATLKAKK